MNLICVLALDLSLVSIKPNEIKGLLLFSQALRMGTVLRHNMGRA